jgi:ABC-type nickel/cobalt efflux system permease component RcnA
MDDPNGGGEENDDEQKRHGHGSSMHHHHSEEAAFALKLREEVTRTTEVVWAQVTLSLSLSILLTHSLRPCPLVLPSFLPAAP